MHIEKVKMIRKTLKYKMSPWLPVPITKDFIIIHKHIQLFSLSLCIYMCDIDIY